MNDMASDPATLIDIIDQSTMRHGGRTAITTRAGLRTVHWSYGDLQQKVNRCAGFLHHGLQLPRGSRVMICAPNSPDTVAVLFGIFRAGLIAVPMDQGSSPDFLASVAQRTDASLIVAAPGLPQVQGLRAIEPRAIANAEAEPFGGSSPSPDDIAEIVFTSGTTGHPKGSVLSHANITANAKAAALIVPPQVPLHLLSLLPLSHMLEQTVGLYLPLLGGGSIHYPASIHPPVILREMRRQQVTGMVVVPRILQLLLEGIEQSVDARGLRGHWEFRHRLSAILPIGLRRHLFRGLHRKLGGNLTFFLCGGAALPADLGQRWEDMGVRIIEGYGSTECSPVIASNSYESRTFGTIGCALANVDVKLSDDGELLVHGPNVSRGYWRDEERTAAAFTRDGWFRTGDIATIDDDGILRITGRLSDRIVLPSGQKVYPADVEQEVRKEPGVLDCAVVALPDDRGRDIVHASIRVEDGCDAARAMDAAVRTANTRLGSHQRIFSHSQWTSGGFPRTSLGKVRRAELRAALLSEKQTSAPSPNRLSEIKRPLDVEARLAIILTGMCKDRDLLIGPETDLHTDLGLDSLGQVELAAAIETQFGIELSEDQLSRITTVRDLQSIIGSVPHHEQQEAFAEWPLGGAAVAVRSILQRALLFPFHRLFCQPFTVLSADRMRDSTGPLLLIANHGSHADTVSILRALPPALRRRTAVAAAADYFYQNRVAGVASSLVLNAFPFSRAGHVRASLERCGELADKGWSILIYPEGTRSPDGSLLPFKSGIGLLAKGLQAEVVPIALHGSAAVLPKGASWPRRGAVRLRFGAPVKLDPQADADDIALQLHEQVNALLNEGHANGT